MTSPSDSQDHEPLPAHKSQTCLSARTGLECDCRALSWSCAQHPQRCPGFSPPSAGSTQPSSSGGGEVSEDCARLICSSWQVDTQEMQICLGLALFPESWRWSQIWFAKFHLEKPKLRLLGPLVSRGHFQNRTFFRQKHYKNRGFRWL